MTFLHLGQADDFARHVSGRSALKSISDIQYILAANRAVPASTLTSTPRPEPGLRAAPLAGRRGHQPAGPAIISISDPA